MSRLDDLSPDQRAALALLLREGKRYADVAALLRIRERAVHDRAHAALALLAPRQARELSAERREEIGDYLLGQGGGLAERLRTRSMLEGSPAAQAWARAVAEELAPLAPTALPEIPNGAGPAEPAAAAVASREPSAGSPPSAARGSVGAAARASAPSPSGSGTRSPARAAARLPSSRVGGAILLGLIAAAVIVAIVLLTSGGGHSRSAGRASSGTSANASSSPRASETKRLTLTPPNPASKALGVAAVLREGTTYAFYLAAEKLPPSKGFFYAVWLYNSPSSYEPLSKSPPVGADGRLQGGALLPSNAGNYHQMIVTRETSERATSPGPVVLRGSFSLH